jgi:hypothetical protein
LSNTEIIALLERIDQHTTEIYQAATYTALTQGKIRSIWSDLEAIRRLLAKR